MTRTPGCSARAAAIWSTVKRRCTEQKPCQRITRASSSCSSVDAAEGSARVPHRHLAPPARPSPWPCCVRGAGRGRTARGVRGAKAHSSTVAGVGRRADDAAVTADEALDRGGGVHVGDRDHGDEAVRVDGLEVAVDVCELLPALLDLVDVGHVGHRAPGGEVGQDDGLVGAGQEVGGLGHEVHAAEDDRLGLRARLRRRWRAGTSRPRSPRDARPPRADRSARAPRRDRRGWPSPHGCGRRARPRRRRDRTAAARPGAARRPG